MIMFVWLFEIRKLIFHHHELTKITLKLKKFQMIEFHFF
jgi:hypothetical protein